MSKIDKLRKLHDERLKKHCDSNQVSFASIEKLLDAERTKKLLKRNAMVQQNIDKEINNAIEDENK
jgi:hypothetical protein